ncbi:MAG TPA: metal-dependent transcriptional regulator [Candidatus Micrarchaeota archaeon]|nr:metal-dependent transcriptional regulator [Candidatus Micrarchaeota archaeon]
MFSVNEQDYLRSIYELQSSCGGSVRTVDIAKELGISKPSASQMISKLKGKGMVERKPYGAVSLTLKGVVEARKVLRRHRLLEVFLVKLLGLKNGFHREAHAMEHSMSDVSERLLEKLVGHPKKCPDGREIPPARRKVISLHEAPVGRSLRVIFSRLGNPDELDRIKSLGLIGGEQVRITRRVSGGPLIVLVKGSDIALGKGVSSQVYVEVLA